MGYGSQPVYEPGQPMYGQPPMYGQQPAYGQAPMYDEEDRHRQGFSGGQVAMAAAGGLAVGAAGMYAAGHMDEIGSALEGAGEWAGGAAGDVGHFVEETFDDIF